MGLLSRMTTVFKTKMSKLLDRVEDPRETLDYSYERQLQLLTNVKRGLAEVVTSKKRIELQKVKLNESVAKLEQQAREALKLGREDLAVAALERKQQLQAQAQALDAQLAELEQEQQKLQATESRLRAKVEAFRTQKEVIKARYSAAEAQVRIGEAATGLSEELADVGLAVERAERKTEDMKARAAAIDELVGSGVLEDKLATKDPIERELAALKGSSEVNAELERLKRELGQS